MTDVDPIPFLDLRTPHRALADEILPEWKEILENAAFVGGPRLEQFESDFARFQQTEHCVAVANGTDALRVALVAMGVKPGDEVITVPHTFIATTEAITQAGGTPVFVDVDEKSGTMDPAALEAAITPKTRVIVPVHLYGQHADIDPILEIARARGIQVLEDAAQAHGAEYNGRRAGNHGAAAASFSFYPGKNLGACGEAGAVVTADADLAARMRMLRDHGQAKKYHHAVEGYNARCDSLQAVALRIKLRHLDGWNEERRQAAAWYAAGLADSGVKVPEDTPAWAGTVHNAAGADAPSWQEANVLVTRRWEAPVTLEAIQAIEDAGAHCLETHRVRFARTFFAADHTRMLCLYQAPDAESVRLAQRQAGMPVEAVWGFRPVRDLG